MPSIEIDSEVLEQLGSQARPFIDTTPNDVLRRLLGLEAEDGATRDEQESLLTFPGRSHNGAKPRTRVSAKRAAAGKSKRRAPKGAILDEQAYWIPILRALDERGGDAAAREVVARVGELVDDQLTALDRETVETGGIRWQSRVQFARLRMKQQGLLSPESPRGIWQITEGGREHLARDTTAVS